MRISDWSSDVCSSDVDLRGPIVIPGGIAIRPFRAARTQRIEIMIEQRAFFALGSGDRKHRGDVIRDIERPVAAMHELPVGEAGPVRRPVNIVWEVRRASWRVRGWE